MIGRKARFGAAIDKGRVIFASIPLWQRHAVLPIAGLLMTLFMTPVYASGDSGCSIAWKLGNPAMTGCNDMAALGPGNDTRVNLLLLLFDRNGALAERPPAVTKPMFSGWSDFRDHFFSPQDADATGYASGEGSRCRSNQGGAAGFEDALSKASDLPEDERETLLAARQALSPTCTDKTGSGPGAEVSIPHFNSASGQAFAAYLHGAAAFYDGRFDEAATAFAALESNRQPWLAETAAYMAARVEVNRLQAGAFDEFGSFKGSAGVDQQVATRAESNLNAYIQHHPSGRYVASARGLLRRVDWLAGRIDKLAAQYSALLATPPAARPVNDAALIEEIDSKLVPNLTPQMTRDPLLLAMIDLVRMRPADRDHGAPIARNDLEAQRGAFGTASPLFDYLLALHAFYVDHDNAAVLKLLPDATKRRDGDYLWFSRQLLRGLALEALGDRNARGFWIELYPGLTHAVERPVVELALAMHDERHNRLKDVFAAGSLVDDPEIRGILLDNVAGPVLLRQQAHDPAAPVRERGRALFALLYKEVTRGRYAGFIADASGPSAHDAVGAPEHIYPQLSVFGPAAARGDFNCPSLQAIAQELAQNLGAAGARLCLAEFVRVNDLDGEAIDIQPPKDELGGTPSLFPGKPYARAATYQAIIADANAPGADRAFALFRAVECYAPSGINQCGGANVPLPQRKAWFMRLKREYPSSRWAKELTYWW